MQEARVLLLSMPWDTLQYPSSQLGTLKALLTRAHIPVDVHTVKLGFMEHLIAGTAEEPEERQLAIGDYIRVAIDGCTLGIGDWIFAAQPYWEMTEEHDRNYLALLRERGVDEEHLTKIQIMRTLVPSFLEHLADEIVAASPAVVGFTCVFSQNIASLTLAKLLKARLPQIKIVFGGANCADSMGVAIHRSFPFVDVVVRGEAERLLPDLLRNLMTGSQLQPAPGLCYWEDGRSIVVDEAKATPVTMEDVPAPDYDEYFTRVEQMSFYAELAPLIQIPYESSRGCWWGAKAHCTFCGIDPRTIQFRSKAPDRLVDEVMHLSRKYSELKIYTVDNILDLGYFSTVLPRLRDSGVDFDVWYEVKSNLKREQVWLLHAAGVRRIQPGIETLSTPILKLMKKGVSAFQNVRLLKWSAEVGIAVVWNFLYGFPGEPSEEYERMADLLPSLSHLEPPSGLLPLVLDRLSPYQRFPREYGIQLIGPKRHFALLYPQLDNATLMDLAQTFEYRYDDGRDPNSYAGHLREHIDAWIEAYHEGESTLRYRRGPGFLKIFDRRAGLEHNDYILDELHAQMYLAFEDGASIDEARAALTNKGLTVDREQMVDLLAKLLEARLVFEEGARYLALALPTNPRKFEQNANLAGSDQVTATSRKTIPLRLAAAS